MSVVAWVTVGILGANIALVFVTYFSITGVSRHQKRSEKQALEQIRYGLEGDVTQIRTTGALIIGKAAGYKKLEEREKQYKITIKELAGKIAKLEEELQSNWGIKEFFRRRLRFRTYRREKDARTAP